MKEQEPNNDRSITTENIPHSGKHGYESPVHDFDNTSLHDAHEQGLLVTPEHPGALTPDTKKGGLKMKLGMGLAAIGLVGTAGFVGKMVGGNSESNSAEKPQTEPSVSAPVAPGEASDPTTSPEVNSEQDKYGISTTDYTTFEDVATAYVAKIDEYLASSSDTFDQPGDSQYLDALLPVDRQSNSEFSTYANDLIDLSITISTNHFATGENGTTEYENNTEVVGFRDIVESDGTLSGYVTLHGTDNVMDTVLAMNATENYDDTTEWHFTFSDIDNDGYWEVTEVDNLETN